MSAQRSKLSGEVIAVPIDILTTPREGHCMVNRYWATLDGRALFYRGRGRKGWSPQCNSNPRVDFLLGDLYPGMQPVFVSAAFLGRDDPDHGFLLNSEIMRAATRPYAEAVRAEQ